MGCWGNGIIIIITSDCGSFPHSLLSTSKNQINQKLINLDPSMILLFDGDKIIKLLSAGLKKVVDREPKLVV